MSTPKPVLTFTVGVTGHRSARLKDEHRARIAQQLSDVFANIEAECRAELDRNKGLYAEENPRLHLITSLADGTDAMAVQQCPPGWTNVGILPYPEARYIAELRGNDRSTPDEAAVAAYKTAREKTAGNVVILPQSGPHDTAGFARARSLLLRQIDILVAVWDDHSPKQAGGTADVIESALEAGIPVIWIAADKVQKPWVILRLEDVRRKSENADATSGPIADIVKHELAVSGRHARQEGRWELDEFGASAEKRLDDFLKERVPNWHAATAYDCITTFPRLWRWRLVKRLSSTSDVGARWADFLSALPDGGEFKARIEAILLPRFAAADALASYYGHKYRSAYVLAYGLSTLAVAVALLGFLIPHVDHPLGHNAVPLSKIVLEFVELVLVGTIVSIVAWGQLGRWHDKWLDYRALAETLRHLRFLGPLGQYEKRAYMEAAARPGAGWVLWYFRATMRELALPAGDFGADYQRKVLSAVIPAELEPQIKYHADNMTALRGLHRWLHVMGDACFVVTLLVLTGFLGVWMFGSIDPDALGRWAPAVTWITAFLPALGAAFAGIRFTGDFEGFAERSAQTGSELDTLRQRCDLALDRLDFDMTAGVLFESARIMAADINGWTTLYSRKHLTLPG
jgi:hypothetical protein